jgi:hypothetical protein
MSPQSQPGPWSSRRRAFVLSALFVVGAGGGIAHARLRDTRDERGAATAVRRAADAVAREDFDTLWNLIDPDTRTQYETSHAKYVEILKAWRADAANEVSGRMVKLVEKESGLDAERLVTSTAQSLWAHRTRRALGEADKVRTKFDSMTVRKIEIDASRARVACELPGEIRQGFHLVKHGDEWTLLDFQPYWDVDRWPSAAAASGAVAKLDPTNTAPGSERSH